MATSRKSTGQPLSDPTLSAGDSPAKTSPWLASEPELTEPEVASGLSMSDAFAFFDPDTSSWRTFQVSLLTQQWDGFSETWPRAGMMQNGTVFPRQPLAPITGGIESGLWPTATKQPSQRQLTNGENIYLTTGERYGVSLLQKARQFPTPRKMMMQVKIRKDGHHSNLESVLAEIEEFSEEQRGNLNPLFVEWLMGYPQNWTKCEQDASATRSSRKSSSGLGSKFLKRKGKHEH